MALPIIEQPLYGEMLIETSPWASTFVWTDRTADLVAGFNYSQGGRVGPPGSSQVDVGTLNATFKNLSSVPGVGALVRISFSKFAGYAFVGYIENVSQRIVFDNSISLTTPITLTTIHCVDWVGYISQFQVVGVGGADQVSGTDLTNSNYEWYKRVAAINKVVDATYATKIISAGAISPVAFMGDTDVVANMSEHLDLVSTTANCYWYPKNILPTNITTGRTGLIEVISVGSYTSSTKTFTDVLGTAGQLHYTEIDFENSTQNVANNIVLNNRARVNITNPDITKIGGFNETNFMVINSQNVVGVGLDRVQKTSDATSITTYGNRQAEFETNVATSTITLTNLIGNPSAEYSDDGYNAGASVRVRRRRPLDETTPFDAWRGEWAIRMRQATTGSTGTIQYFGTESDGTPVVPGALLPYRVLVYARRGSPSATDARFRVEIDWKDADENTISSTIGAYTALTLSTAWYRGGAAASAPANATRAVIKVLFSRSGGGNIAAGNNYWIDGLFMGTYLGLPDPPYIDGDQEWSAGTGYAWTGGVGSSPSIAFENKVDDAAAIILAKYANTSIRVSRIRWNAQEQLSAIPSLSVGKTISLVYKGTTTTYRIIGIDGNVDPERYMIDYYLVKV
jgi:hypothetical protein